MELASLLGDLSTIEEEPAVHAHAVVGLSDGSTLAGHLIRADVHPVCELFLTAFSTPMELKASRTPELLRCNCSCVFVAALARTAGKPVVAYANGGKKMLSANQADSVQIGVPRQSGRAS